MEAKRMSGPWRCDAAQLLNEIGPVPSVPDALRTILHLLSGLAPETPVRAEEKRCSCRRWNRQPDLKLTNAGSSGRGTLKRRRTGVHHKVVRLSQRARVLVVAHEGQTSHRR